VSDTNQRQHIRTKLRAGIRLSHADVGSLKLRTADISDGGAYIFSEGNSLPNTGEVVYVEILGVGGDEAPLVKMKIVRDDGRGIGLEFVDED